MLRTSAHRHRPIPCVRGRSLCAWGLSRRGTLSAHPYMHKIDWGGRWLNGHHMLHGPPHARFMYWHSSTMAHVFKRWQFSHPSTSDLDHVKDESVNLTALAE